MTRRGRRFSDATYERMREMRRRGYAWRFIARFYAYPSEGAAWLDYHRWVYRRFVVRREPHGQP